MMDGRIQLAHWADMDGRSWYQHHEMAGWFMGIHGLYAIFALIVVVFVVLVFTRSRGRDSSANFSGRGNDATDTQISDLEVRYAKGKIDHAEYIRRRRELGP